MNRTTLAAFVALLLIIISEVLAFSFFKRCWSDVCGWLPNWLLGSSFTEFASYGIWTVGYVLAGFYTSRIATSRWLRTCAFVTAALIFSPIWRYLLSLVGIFQQLETPYASDTAPLLRPVSPDFNQVWYELWANALYFDFRHLLLIVFWLSSLNTFLNLRLQGIAAEASTSAHYSSNPRTPVRQTGTWRTIRKTLAAFHQHQRDAIVPKVVPTTLTSTPLRTLTCWLLGFFVWVALVVTSLPYFKDVSLLSALFELSDRESWSRSFMEISAVVFAAAIAGRTFRRRLYVTAYMSTALAITLHAVMIGIDELYFERSLEDHFYLLQAATPRYLVPMLFLTVLCKCISSRQHTLSVSKEYSVALCDEREGGTINV